MNRKPSSAELTAYRAFEKHGTIAAAADELGLSPDTVRNHLDRLRKWAAAENPDLPVIGSIQLAPILRKAKLL